MKETLKKFWKFLNEDSWASLFVFMILVLGVVLFFKFYGFEAMTGTPLTLVIVESCSMHHESTMAEVFESEIYEEYNISLEDSNSWDLKKGFTKGDIIFSVGPKELEVGDVIIFSSGRADVKYPIIHRIIRIDPNITTKGDNNSGLLDYEKEINPQSVIAKSVFRIPYIGWIKLIFFDWKNPPSQRGLC